MFEIGKIYYYYSEERGISFWFSPSEISNNLIRIGRSNKLSRIDYFTNYNSSWIGLKKLSELNPNDISDVGLSFDLNKSTDSFLDIVIFNLGSLKNNVSPLRIVLPFSESIKFSNLVNGDFYCRTLNKSEIDSYKRDLVINNIFD